MKFGAIPVDEAEGTILAHSVKLEGLALKKGRRLAAEDLETLRAGGVERVMAARLEPGDVHEDEAVTHLELGEEVESGATATVTTLQGDPKAVNTRDDRPIQPEETVFEGVDDTFEYTFPGHSVTFLRVPTV